MTLALLALTAVDWASFERKAAAIDREIAKVHPVITPFCGAGDWMGQYIGYPDAAGTGWRKIRLFSDAGKYSMGFIDIYPGLGYQHEIRENIEFVAGGPGWQETRIADGQGQTRQAKTRSAVTRQPWRSLPAGDLALTGQLNEAIAALEQPWDRATLTWLHENVVFISPNVDSDNCDLPVAPELLPLLRRDESLFKRPVRIRMELRKLRLNRIEGALVGVEPIP